MAERSKASDLGSDPQLWAWVRIPLLTIHFSSIKLMSTNLFVLGDCLGLFRGEMMLVLFMVLTKLFYLEKFVYISK